MEALTFTMLNSPPPIRSSHQMNLVPRIPPTSIPLPSPITFSHFRPKFPKPVRTTAAARFPVPPRDRVIDFGKYRGNMLGSLPSAYLKWVSKNLRAGDTEEWARLADEVLSDAVYRDRIEWESAERVLNGDNGGGRSSDGGGAVSELLEISERFGWDNEDKVGWSKIDFGLLGTSKGGRIPRVKEEEVVSVEVRKEERVEGGGGERRVERRERARRRRRRRRVETTSSSSWGGMERVGGEEMNNGGEDEGSGGVGRSRFPGREGLLKKVLLNRHGL